MSLLFLAIGDAARITIMDKKPDLKISKITVKDLLSECTKAFEIKRNRTLDRYTFFTRKQYPRESLEHFWNVLNGLAAKCEFGVQTQSLVSNFLANMNNLSVQEKL